MGAKNKTARIEYSSKSGALVLVVFEGEGRETGAQNKSSRIEYSPNSRALVLVVLEGQGRDHERQKQDRQNWK